MFDEGIKDREGFEKVAQRVLGGAGGNADELRRDCCGLYYYLNSIVGDDLKSVRDSEDVLGGIALSPTGASMCVMDGERTRSFARGLCLAINKAKEMFSERPIRVLYAGCGPFALFATLVAPFFKDGEVEFVAMDVYQVSINCVRKVADCLGQAGKFGRFLCEDATRYRHEGPKFHIIITEAMRSLLQSEPQVAITANLGDQVVDGGFFLPEEVKIFAEIESQNGKLEALGDIFTLTKDISVRVKRDGAIDRGELWRVLDVRRQLQAGRPLDRGMDQILIHTRVKVFEDAVLLPGSSDGLTKTYKYPVDSYGDEKSVYVSFTITMGNLWVQGADVRCYY